MSKRHTIYCFHNSRPESDGVAYAMRDDGVVLASHFCSSAGFAYMDLGVDPERDWSNKRAIYADQCPGGFDLEWVPDPSTGNCPGLDEAYRLNQVLRVERDRGVPQP